MNKLFTSDFELKPAGRKLVLLFSGFYLLLLVLMCFLPQSFYPSLKNVETPGIIHLGRLVFLPLPFNSLFQLGRIPSLGDLVVIVMQNVSNVFLLYPLVLPVLFLSEKWRNVKVVLYGGFLISLSIECTQLLLDLFFDFNRVFETDDLITNTLGAFLAYASYKSLRHLYLRQRA